MEYAAGPTLQDVLKAKGALPPADVVYYVSQVAEGLAHAHARGVLHRDIKPSNLLLTEGRKVKVLDFGLGTLLEKDELATELTAAGITVGTPDYISPEQARMVKIDGRSDLYSLGCTMYHLISGQLPFKGESSMDCIVGRITGQAAPIGEILPGLPPRLVQAIEKLMASNPDDRYQTADEAAAALRSLLRPKNAAAARSAPAPASAPTEAAAASAPAPVPKVSPTPEAPLPPVPSPVRSSKPKSGSLRSRWTGPGTKVNRVLVAAAAVGALALIGGTILLFMPSKDNAPVSQEETSPTNNGLTNNSSTLSAGGAEANKGPAIPAGGAQANKGPTTPAGGADVRQASLVIESPKQGATVGMREELTGRIETEGWPVIFVQADIPGQPWWCQAPVERVDGGKFSAKVIFGDDLTPSGMKFRVAGILTRSREEALKFGIGSKEQALPEGFPRSVVVVVTHQ
jgi:serine/threonine protein kinase